MNIFVEAVFYIWDLAEEEDVFSDFQRFVPHKEFIEAVRANNCEMTVRQGQNSASSWSLAH